MTRSSDEARDRRLAALLDGHDRESGYEAPEVSVEGGGRDVFVVSDLHLAAGAARDGTYVGTENFFADAAFARWLSQLGAPAGPATLVINGDFVDFIRVMEVPTTPEDCRRWSDLLAPLGIYRSPKQLAGSVRRVECRHGLRTTDYKSVWKLAVVVRGHPLVFDALAEWVARGGPMVILKGNHDVEWYWAAVRNYFRLVLACRLGGDPVAALRRVLPLVVFADHAVVIDRTVYIEHGHRYEPLTSVVGSPLLDDRQELRLPFGSFFNRYVINHIELGYPFIDNIRPRENILPVLIRERFPTALRLLAQHVPLMLKTIPRGYYRYHLQRVLPFVIVIGVPVVAALMALRGQIPQVVGFIQQPPVGGGLLGAALGLVADGIRSLAWLVLSYVGSQLLAAFQLAGSHGLEPHARALFAARPELRHIVLGHTHDPEQAERHGRWYYNTGTWIPVIETTSASVRYDRTYTFLHLPPEAPRDGHGQLYRWNDEAGRAEPAVVIRRS